MKTTRLTKTKTEEIVKAIFNLYDDKFTVEIEPFETCDNYQTIEISIIDNFAINAFDLQRLAKLTGDNLPSIMCKDNRLYIFLVQEI